MDALECVPETFVSAFSVLHIGGGLEDGGHNGAGGGVWLDTSVY